MTLSKILRGLPAFKGKNRLAKKLLSKKILNSSGITVEGKFGCKYLLPNAVENVGFDIFINGMYEPEIYQVLNDAIPPNGVFVDIGANIGAITIPLAKTRPDISILAVEAAPWVFKYLEKNIALNGLKNVQIINKAVYDRDGLILDFFSPEDKFGKDSLSPVFSCVGVKIETKTIDTLLNEHQITKVDVMKVDVEGFEYFVFKGGAKLVAASAAPVIVFEFVDWAEKLAEGLMPGAAQKVLLENGYSLFMLKGNEKEKITERLTAGASNIIAIKK